MKIRRKEGRILQKGVGNEYKINKKLSTFKKVQPNYFTGLVQIQMLNRNRMYSNIRMLIALIKPFEFV